VTSRADRPLILIVEDQPANLLLAQITMERNGFDVIAAGDADEARAHLAHVRPALILMDVGLPGQDGLSLTRELKSETRTADIPVVALTAHAMLADEQNTRAAGCDGYMSKPFRPRDLVALVESLIAARLQPDIQINNPAGSLNRAGQNHFDSSSH
jgi:two-component system, cell cycle response regulator DivK